MALFVWRGDVVKKAIHDKILEAIETSTREVQREAVRLAPKRRVFKGMRRARTRMLTGGELKAERAVRAKLGLATRGPIFTTNEVRKNERPSNPYLRGAGRRPQSAVDDDDLRSSFKGMRGRLNAYGRNAIRNHPKIEGPEYSGTFGDKARILALKKSNSAKYKNSSGKWQLGGRLKGEIRSSVEQTRRKITGTVVSPTYYAKYVEFGTRRSRAQPFLRPAIAKERRNLRRRIEGRLRNLGAPK